MKKNLSITCGVVLLVLLSFCTESLALQLDGLTRMRGEVLASACNIVLNDRYQEVSMGDLTLRDFHRAEGRPVRKLVIHLEKCFTSEINRIFRKEGGTVRVRFDGIRGREPWMFGTQGGATGIALILRDEREELVYPGEYLIALYQKKYSKPTFEYRIELVPDGNFLTSGDYSSAIRFSIDYE